MNRKEEKIFFFPRGNAFFLGPSQFGIFESIQTANAGFGFLFACLFFSVCLFCWWGGLKSLGIFFFTILVNFAFLKNT